MFKIWSMNSRNSWVRHLLNQNINSQHRWQNADAKTSKCLQLMLTVYYIYREIFNHFSFERTTQEWLQTTDCKRFQSTSLSLKEMKMFHSSYDDWYSTKHYYKCKTEIITEIRHYYLRSSQSIYDDWFSL